MLTILKAQAAYLTAALLVAVSPAMLLSQDATEADDNAPAPTTAIKKRETTKFVRVLRDEYKSPVALQTATAKYVLKDEQGNVTLELFLESAIHVGDPAYYRGFNQRFKHYDAVLYELIAPEDRQIPNADSENLHPAQLLQQIVSDGLGFAHQIAEVNYKADNMIHSDLSPKEMAAARKKRGEDDFVLLADMFLDLVKQMNRNASAGEDDAEGETAAFDLELLSDPDGGVKIRRMLATTFNGADAATALRPTQHASIIRDRNGRAMKVLQEQLDKGKRRVALFWGAAHMPDFERQLILAYGVEPAGVNWRSAWDLRDGAVRRAPIETLIERTLRDVLGDALSEKDDTD